MASPEKPQERHEEPLSLQAAGDKLFGEGWREQVSDGTAADGDESGNADAASGTLESEVDAAYAERDQRVAAAETLDGTPTPEEAAQEWAEYLGRGLDQVSADAKKRAKDLGIDEKEARNQVVSETYNVPIGEIVTETFDAHFEAADKWRKAKKAELAERLRKDPDTLSKIEEVIEQDRQKFEDRQKLKDDGRRFSEVRAAVRAVEAVGLLGEGTDEGKFDDQFAIQVLNVAKGKRAKESKRARAEARQSKGSLGSAYKPTVFSRSSQGQVPRYRDGSTMDDDEGSYDRRSAPSARVDRGAANTEQVDSRADAVGSPEDNEDTIIAHVERMKTIVTAIGGLEAAISTGPGAASPEKQQQLEALYAELKDLTAKAEAFPRDDSEPLVQTPQEQADALAIEMAEIMKDTNLDEIDDAKLTQLKELIGRRNALLESTGEPGEPGTTIPEVLPGLGPLVSEAELAALEKAYREEQDPEKKAAAIEVYRQAREQYNQQQERIAEQTRALREQVAGEKQEGEDLTYAERLKVAMGTYAELKADIETKGIDVKLGKITLWRGRAKREKLLKQAEAELTAAQIAYEKAVIAKKKEANLYEGDDAQIAAQGRNDLFTAMRGLDAEARKATNEILDDHAENRSLYRRASMKLFGWMGKSGKLATIGTVGAGVASGVGIVMSGVGWPITTAAVAGAKLSIYQGVKTRHLDALRAETIDENGNLKGTMSDTVFERIRVAENGNPERSAEESAAAIATHFFEASRQEGHERLDKARKAAKRAAGKFAIGVAIGAGGAGLYKWADGSVHAMQGGSGDHSGSEGTSNGAWGSGEPEPPHNGGAVDVDTGEKLAETDFDVEYGSGLERELRQFAKANGHKLNPIQADQLHRDLMRKFGKDYIDLKGISQDTYMHGTDVRLSAPAEASWDNGVPEYVQQWMEQRGLWN